MEHHSKFDFVSLFLWVHTSKATHYGKHLYFWHSKTVQLLQNGW